LVIRLPLIWPASGRVEKWWSGAGRCGKSADLMVRLESSKKRRSNSPERKVIPVVTGLLSVHLKLDFILRILNK
jgi:hypothetical protein